MKSTKPESGDLDSWLAYVADPGGALVAIKDPDCPIPAIEKAIATFPHVERSLVHSQVAPGYILERLFETGFQDANTADVVGARDSIVKNRNATERILSLALNDPDVRVRQAAAEVITNELQLLALASDSDVRVQVAVAKNKNSSKRILEIIVTEGDSSAAGAVLENTACPEYLFAIAAKRADFDQNIAYPILRRGPVGVLDFVLDKFPTLESGPLLQNPNASVQQLRRVIGSGQELRIKDYLVGLCKRDDVPGDLLWEALKKTHDNSQELFAESSSITQEVFDYLVARKSVDTILSLIRNPRVPGEWLMPLVANKSKKVQLELRRKTYSRYEGNFAWSEIPFLNREDLFVALKIDSSLVKYSILATVYGEPFVIGVDEDFMTSYQNGNHDPAVWFGVPKDSFEEFSESQLAVLIEEQDEDELDTTSQGVVLLDCEDSGWEIYKQADEDDDGYRDVMVSLHAGFQIEFEAESIEELRKSFVEQLLRYLVVVDGDDTDYSEDIFRIEAMVFKGSEAVTGHELWFENAESAAKLEAWPDED